MTSIYSELQGGKSPHNVLQSSLAWPILPEQLRLYMLVTCVCNAAPDDNDRGQTWSFASRFQRKIEMTINNSRGGGGRINFSGLRVRTFLPIN